MRTLDDLYRVQTKTTLDDGQGGEPITVWLVKLDHVDFDVARRQANAERARLRAQFRDPDSESSLALGDAVEVILSDNETAIEIAMQEEALKRMEAAEAQVESSPEWHDNGYLEGLRRSWHGGLQQRYLESPDDARDPEAAQVWAELQRYAAMVDEQTKPQIDALRADFATLSEDTMREKIYERLRKTELEMVWMNSVAQWEVFYSTRHAITLTPREIIANVGVDMPGNEDDIKALAEELVEKGYENTKPGGRYFDDKERVDRLAEEVFTRLRTEYRMMVVSVTEGKGSRATPSSSPSSDAPETGETDQPSGPPTAEVSETSPST